ncbi:MAG TPA: MFS transporter [Anaerovoracaceae bacterium]|nr:MFS transporter [Anaerovoracaceae bacterium]
MGSRISLKNIRSGFPALHHRNFRLFWFGQCISLIGTWMQNIGQSWLVLELTHSALKLSIVTMMQFLPMMFFSLYAGTLIDRIPKRKMLIYTQSTLAVLAAVLATLTYFKVVEYWHLLILALLLGVVSTLDMPTRQAFVIELVGKEDTGQVTEYAGAPGCMIISGIIGIFAAAYSIFAMRGRRSHS